MKGFVANPANGSRHNRGSAADITLYDLKLVSRFRRWRATMNSRHDRSHSIRAEHRDSVGIATCYVVRWEAEDFTIYEYEWWHFDYKDWKDYAIGNATFEQLD